MNQRWRNKTRNLYFKVQKFFSLIFIVLSLNLIFSLIGFAANIEPLNTQPSMNSNETILKINQLRQKGDLISAKKIAQSYLKIHPNDVDIILMLGLISYQQLNYSQAEIYFNEVLAQSPNYLDAKLGLIRIKIAQKNFAEASRLMKEIKKEKNNRPDIKEVENLLIKATKQKNKKKQMVKPNVLLQIKTDIKNKNLKSAKALALETLKSQPNNPDIFLMLGLISYQQKTYPEAEKYFNRVLKIVPSYIDATLGLIRIKILQKQYFVADKLLKQVIKTAPHNKEVRDVEQLYLKAKNATVKNKKEMQKNVASNQLQLADIVNSNVNYFSVMTRINRLLKYYPNNSQLLSEKAGLLYSHHLNSQANYYAQKSLMNDPDNKLANEIQSTINEVDPYKTHGLNEMGFSTFNQYVSDIHEIWDFSTLYYSRETEVGVFYTKLNYAERFNTKAPQIDLEFLPVVTSNFYLDIEAAYANEPTLFPKYLLTLEGYGTIPSVATLSFGTNYNDIIGSIYYTKYTASLAKEFKNYWINFRVNHYVPSAGRKSTLYMANFRRYFGNNDFYLTLTLGTGKSPDLASLQTVDFLVIKNRFANLTLRFPVFNYRTLIDLGLDYENWKYPSHQVRQLYGLNIGLNFKF